MNFKEQRAVLDAILRKLESHFGFPHDLKVEWLPGESFGMVGGRPAAGTVKNGTIYIWGSDFDEAKETLVHEFVEWILTEEFTEPYDDLLNRFIKHFEAQTYKRRERLVNRLTKFIIKEATENGE